MAGKRLRPCANLQEEAGTGGRKAKAPDPVCVRNLVLLRNLNAPGPLLMEIIVVWASRTVVFGLSPPSFTFASSPPFLQGLDSSLVAGVQCKLKKLDSKAWLLKGPGGTK